VLFAEQMLPLLAEVGWVAAPEPGDSSVRKWSVCHPHIEYRSHHLHVAEDRPAYRAGKAPFIQDVLRRIGGGTG
jgi:hypothetical protein